MTLCTLHRAASTVSPRALSLAVTLAAALIATASLAEGDAELVDSINAYRDAPRRCEGRSLPRADALAPSAPLARVEVPRGGDLGTALDHAGYQAATSRLIWIAGASDARDVMTLLQQRHCAAMLDPRYTEVGVFRSGRQWRIVLAQPLLTTSLGDWREAGQAVLARVNTARAESRQCGGRHFDAAPPLIWNERLAQAALAHSRDMAASGALAHEGSDGSTPAQRTARHGYDWRAVGENVAGGQGSAAAVVDGWLQSPVHCANLMAPEFTEMGAAYAHEPGSRLHIYWAQLLATPR